MEKTIIHTEQAQKRAKNRYAILRTLQSVQPMKRTELANYCTIRKSSVTSLIEELLENKWVQLENKQKPRSPLMMHPKSWETVCAELDTDRITAARINLAGEITDIQEFTFPSTPSKKEILEQLENILLKVSKQSKKLLGIGLSVPGLVDSETGTCISSINLPEFDNVPLKEILSQKFKAPIVIENDVRSSLYSRLFLDTSTTTLNSALFVDITSGVGSASLVQGKALSGFGGAAGEIGHLKAGEEGRICRCGQKDCLETYSSIPAICQQINTRFNLQLKSSRDIVTAVQKNSQISTILKDACEHLALPLSAIIAALDPELLILGNQPRAFYELITPFLQDSLASRLHGPATRNLKIEIAREHSSLRGVAALLMDQQFATPN